MAEFANITCPHCGVIFYIPTDLQASAMRDPKISVYCPHGHRMHYPAGETEAEKLRRERDLLKQRLAHKDDQIDAERRRADTAKRKAAGYKRQVTRLTRRAAAGVCPCCNRTFTNLARHMADKHPGFAPEHKESGGG